jgi:hypothetical protein
MSLQWGMAPKVLPLFLFCSTWLLGCLWLAEPSCPLHRASESLATCSRTHLLSWARAQNLSCHRLGVDGVPKAEVLQSVTSSPECDLSLEAGSLQKQLG